MKHKGTCKKCEKPTYSKILVCKTCGLTRKRNKRKQWKHKKVCVFCTQKFLAYRYNARYCNPKCLQKHNTQKRRKAGLKRRHNLFYKTITNNVYYRIDIDYLATITEGVYYKGL